MHTPMCLLRQLRFQFQGIHHHHHHLHDLLPHSHVQTDDRLPGSPVKGGRLVSYKVADENGEFAEMKEATITFRGSGLEELVEMLEEETGLADIIVCSPWGGKLYPLRLQLPPNNAPMHVVVVPPSSAGNFF